MKYGESILTQLKKKIEKRIFLLENDQITQSTNLNAPDHLIL